MLPAPDALECTLPEGTVCLVTDDGTETPIRLAQALTARDWRVVLLRFPPTLVEAPARDLPDGVGCVTLDDARETTLAAQLAAVTAAHGPIGGFIHLNPVGNGELFSAREETLLKAVFFLAKHLKTALNQAATQGRAPFVTVTRLDGALGLDSAEAGAISGGLCGLTKTLALEWPAVFCRVVDISPTFAAAQTVRALLAELHDPNRRLVEVGYGAQGRATIVIQTERL